MPSWPLGIPRLHFYNDETDPDEFVMSFEAGIEPARRDEATMAVGELTPIAGILRDPFLRFGRRDDSEYVCWRNKWI